MSPILLDQGLSPGAAAILRSQGYDVVHVSEVELAAADDEVIIEFAKRAGRACVTLDHDFHAYLALKNAGSPSVVLLRAEGLNSTAQAETILHVWRVCGQEIAAGAAVSVNGRSIRLRRLPLR